MADHFASGNWHVAKGKEQEFVGQLSKAPSGKVGFGRMNPYRLTITTYREEIKEEVQNGVKVKITPR